MCDLQKEIRETDDVCNQANSLGFFLVMEVGRYRLIKYDYEQSLTTARTG